MKVFRCKKGSQKKNKHKTKKYGRKLGKKNNKNIKKMLKLRKNEMVIKIKVNYCKRKCQ